MLMDQGGGQSHSGCGSGYFLCLWVFGGGGGYLLGLWWVCWVLLLLFF